MAQNRIKVLFILQNLNGGGAERHTLNVMRHLDRSRFAPGLFLFERVGVYFDEVPADVPLILGCQARRWSKLRTPHVLRRLVTAGRDYDVLIGALQMRPTYLTFAAGKLLAKPTVGWVRNAMGPLLQNYGRWHRWATKLVYPRLDQAVLNSNGSHHSLAEIVALRPDRARVIYNLVDLDMIRRRAEEPCPSWAHEVFAKPTVVGVGRLMRQKGFDLLIRAHAMLRDEGVDHHLLILGSGHLRDELEALARQLGVRTSVFMPGYANNPYPLVKRATAFALSSRFEGLANVLIEAMALGVPVVAANCVAGPDELLVGGHYGVLVRPEDPQALADGIARVLGEEGLRAELSERGRLRCEYFAPHRISRQWEALLSEVACRSAMELTTATVSATVAQIPGVASEGESSCR
jgi:glycosyltransferase involved in cell wall biosynthesis